MKAQIVVRSQKSVGSSFNKFGGPDKYIAVVLHEGNYSGQPLRQDSARKHNWQIKYFGEGYSKNIGPRSMYGKALQAAKDFVSQLGDKS